MKKKRTRLSDEALQFFREQGAKGGQARKKKLTKEELSAQATKAVQERWRKAREKAKKAGKLIAFCALLLLPMRGIAQPCRPQVAELFNNLRAHANLWLKRHIGSGQIQK